MPSQRPLRLTFFRAEELRGLSDLTIDNSVVWDTSKAICIEQLDTDDEVAQEIATVAYIYPELVIYDQRRCSLDIPVSFDSPKQVLLEGDNTENCTTAIISHLPSLKVRFTLKPISEAQSEAPLHFEILCFWFPSRFHEQLKHDIYEYWKDTESQLLYYTIEYISELAKDAFSADSYAAGEPLRIECKLVDEILTYNRTRTKEQFNQKSYTCGICIGMLSWILDLVFSHTDSTKR